MKAKKYLEQEYVDSYRKPTIGASIFMFGCLLAGSIAIGFVFACCVIGFVKLFNIIF